MGDLEDSPKDTETIKTSDMEQDGDIHDKIQNIKTKKKKRKATTLSDSSVENEMKIMAETNKPEKEKLEQRSQQSVERLIRQRDGDRVEKNIKHGPDTDSEPAKKHDFWEESDFESKAKSRTQRIYDADRNRLEAKRESFREGSENRIKNKPGRYSSDEKKPYSKLGREINEGKSNLGRKKDSSTEVRNRNRYTSPGKHTKKYDSEENLFKHKPGRDSSAEIKKKQFGDENDKYDKYDKYRMTKKEKIVRTRPEIYSDTGRNKQISDSDSSPEYRPKPTSMDDSPENRNTLDAGDSNEEQNVQKNWPSDLSQEKKLRLVISLLL